MSAMGHKRTFALQKPMSALPPIATAKADIGKPSCPLYPRKRTFAAAVSQKSHGGAQACGLTTVTPIADKGGCGRTVCFVPEADVKTQSKRPPIEGGLKAEMWRYTFVDQPVKANLKILQL
jgi:hypothetical protein